MTCSFVLKSLSEGGSTFEVFQCLLSPAYAPNTYLPNYEVTSANALDMFS